MASLVALVCCIFSTFCVLLSQQQVIWTLTGKSRRDRQYARNGEDFILTCKVQERPNNILWYRNDWLVASLMTESCQNEKRAKERYICTCEDSLLFSLTIPGENITQVEQGTTWLCSNPHGIKSEPFVLNTIEADWTLTGESSKGRQYARNGEDFVLTCKVQIRQNTVLWFRNSRLVAAIMDGSCQNVAGVKGRYIYTCDGSFLFSLTIPGENIANVEQGTTWSCSNPSGQRSENFVLNTIDPVQNVSISPNSEIKIDVGDTINLLCATDACRPKAKITWHVGNKTMEGKDNRFSEQSNKYITRSNLSLQAQIEDNRKDVYCTASNSVEDKVYSDKIRINLNYPPPGPPYIEEFVETATLNENQNVTFTCILHGGNPLANLSWRCFGIKGNIKNQKEEAISKITFITNKTMNGQLCTCFASHRVNGYEYKVQLNISIRSTKTFEIGDVSHPLIVSENEPIMLRCKENVSISADRFWNKNKNNIIVEENNLHFQPITCFDNGNYSCQSRDVNDSTESACLEVYVKCKPRILSRSSEMTAFVEGEEFTVSLEFISYPYPDITWSVLQNKTKTSVTLENNTDGYWILKNRTLYAYTLQVVKNKMYSKDFGEYELLLINEIGNSSATFTVIKKADIPMKTLFKKSMLFKVIPSSIVAAAVFIIVPLVIKKYISRLRTRNRIGKRNNRATENHNTDSIADSPKSTSYISEIGSVFYVNCHIETVDYQNACRIKELEAESPYDDLEPEDKVQVSHEWPYKEIDRDSPAYLEPIVHSRPYSGVEHEIQSDTQSYMECDPI